MQPCFKPLFYWNYVSVFGNYGARDCYRVLFFKFYYIHIRITKQVHLLCYIWLVQVCNLSSVCALVLLSHICKRQSN